MVFYRHLSDNRREYARGRKHRPMLYVLQCGLVDYHSHYYQETLGQIAACRDQGIDLKLYANRSALESIVAATGAIPAFRDSPDGLLKIDPAFDHLANFITMGERFAEDCMRLAADGASRGDIVFVPHARIRHLHGLAKWLETLRPDARPTIALRFDDPDESWLAAQDTFADEAGFTRFAIAELLDLIPPGRLLLFATTPLLCEIVTQISGFRCARLPIAIFYPPMEEIAALRAASPKPPAQICIAGEFRAEKGADLVPDILAEYGRRFPGAAISLQVNLAAELDGLRATLDERGVDVRLIAQVGDCGIREHYARLLAAEIVLLPYRQHRYVARGSGVFADAVACGIPVVAPKRTWMSHQLEQGRAAGTSFGAFTVESIVEALFIATEALPELTALARARQPAWHAQENVAEATRAIMQAVAAHAAPEGAA